MAIMTKRREKEYSEKIKLIPEITKTVAGHDAELKRVTKTMFGNGDIGWDERLRIIEKWIEMQMEKEKKRIAWWDKFQWVVIPIVVTGFLAFIGQAFVFWIRIVPNIP